MGPDNNNNNNTTNNNIPALVPRFGWIDEHLAVVPRAAPSPSCGQGRTGLVEWRTSVKKHFDVFCFNQSGRASSHVEFSIG